MVNLACSMGGLGITKFQDQAQALKQRSINKIFVDYNNDYVLVQGDCGVRTREGLMGEGTSFLVHLGSPTHTCF